MPLGITAHARLVDAEDVGDVAAHVVAADDDAVGAVGHPALDAVDVRLRVLLTQPWWRPYSVAWTVVR